MRAVSYLVGTAPASLVVVRGMGRALNPTERSGKPQNTNLSAFTYDNVRSKHKNGQNVNNFRTEAFDTPIGVTRKNTGWMTVKGGKDGLTITFAPDAVVVYAEVVDKNGNVEVVTDMLLSDYQNTYC